MSYAVPVPGYVPITSKWTPPPTVASPHPPVDHTAPIGAIALVFVIDEVWLLQTSFPFAAGAVVVVTLASWWIVGRLRKKLLAEPRGELVKVIEPWILLTIAVAAGSLADGLATGAAAQRILKDLATATMGAALFGLIPAGVIGLFLGKRAAEGGAVPLASRARRAIALGPWRSAVSSLFVVNIFAVIPVPKHSQNPLSSVGSIIALACVLLLVYIIVAQRYWLTSSPPNVTQESRGGAYREAAPAPPPVDPVSAQDRAALASRELVRGVVALLFALLALALHVWLLLG
ncbi:MAG TPA: hypothetical protein PLI95_00435 [Polyangiaceae bacterium]|nr:hypothetical protein [Polyangiaceae bacterium]